MFFIFDLSPPEGGGARGEFVLSLSQKRQKWKPFKEEIPTLKNWPIFQSELCVPGLHNIPEYIMTKDRLNVWGKSVA